MNYSQQKITDYSQAVNNSVFINAQPGRLKQEIINAVNGVAEWGRGELFKMAENEENFNKPLIKISNIPDHSSVSQNAAEKAKTSLAADDVHTFTLIKNTDINLYVVKLADYYRTSANRILLSMLSLNNAGSVEKLQSMINSGKFLKIHKQYKWTPEFQERYYSEREIKPGAVINLTERDIEAFQQYLIEEYYKFSDNLQKELHEWSVNMADPERRDAYLLSRTDISKLPITEKMALAIVRAPLDEAILIQLGDIKVLILSVIIFTGLLMGLTALNLGKLVKILAGLLLAAGIVLPIIDIFAGLNKLIDFYNKADRATDLAGIDEAGIVFAEAIAKLGVGALFLILAFAGGKSFKNKIVSKSKAKIDKTGEREADVLAEFIQNLKKSQAGKGSEWIKPKGWKLPKAGKWSGQPGNSNFIPKNPSELGLKPGEVIKFEKGYPDFSPWSKGEFNVPKLDGSKADFSKIYEVIAKEKGFLKKNGNPNKFKAKQWLDDNQLAPHHAGGEKVQLIPYKLHGCRPKSIPGVTHHGGAFELRSK